MRALGVRYDRQHHCNDLYLKEAHRFAGSDGVDDLRRRYQCFLFLRDPGNPSEPDSNHYAMPLAISPVFDVREKKVVRIETLPSGPDEKPTSAMYRPGPANEYMPKYQKLREDLKPLHVQQPQGASFTVVQDSENSQTLAWQKWHMRVGFNAREGLVLHDVSNKP